MYNVKYGPVITINFLPKIPKILTNSELTIDTPYFAHEGEIWGVFSE